MQRLLQITQVAAGHFFRDGYPQQPEDCRSDIFQSGSLSQLQADRTFVDEMKRNRIGRMRSERLPGRRIEHLFAISMI